MNISSASASAASLTYAQTMQLRAAAKQAADDRKAEVETDKAKVMASPVFKGADAKKAQAKARIQQIMDWLKIARKLFAMDPKGMAKALAQVFKDLKSAVKAYKDAGGDEMSASGAATGAVMADTAPAKAKDDKPAEASEAEEPAAETADKPAEAASETPPETPTETPQQTTTAGSDLYRSVVDEVKKAVGEDGLDFVKTVRDTVNEIVKLLDASRGQAAIRKRDKETDKAFEDAGKALKELREEVDSMEQDIRREAPTAGMKLSVAA